MVPEVTGASEVWTCVKVEAGLVAVEGTVEYFTYKMKSPKTMKRMVRIVFISEEKRDGRQQKDGRHSHFQQVQDSTAKKGLVGRLGRQCRQLGFAEVNAEDLTCGWIVEDLTVDEVRHLEGGSGIWRVDVAKVVELARG